MGPRLRKSALTAHVVTSVGWLGAVGAFLALAITALASDDEQLVRGVHRAAEPLVWFVIVPLAVASLVTGVIQSLGTHWGLFRHYWVIFKEAIAVGATAILLLYTQTVGHLADTARAGELDELRSATFVLHSSVALLLLLAATILAIFKPRGMTRFGLRRDDRTLT